MKTLTDSHSIITITPDYVFFNCFRLMGFTLSDARLLSSHGISNTQLYHMAGNSIVVDVLMEIFKEIYLL